MSKNVNYILYLIILCTLSACTEPDGFQFIEASDSNLTFNNQIPEHPTINILNFEYLYNGGGVGAADFNKDGKMDLYFAGNMVGNALFLNAKDFKFYDITKASGTAATGKWSNGISIVDINNDGWADIYVSVSSLSLGAEPKNLLFINQGNNKKGLPTFTEEAEKYGLASTKHSRHAAFFDYDLDGDLDVYVLNNIIDMNDATSYRRKNKNGTAVNNDQLFQNQGNGQFIEVSKEAGIVFEGYGLGVAISDINQDGYPDIYVANDYLSNDLLYINQKDGTFKNEIAERIKLQSKFAMGVSTSDFNNDGATDILVLDMLSATSNRLKRHVKGSNYNNRKNNKYYNYEEQVSRNTLQKNDGTGHFGEVGFHAGIFASDWSWSPLTADFNNDGWQDVYVTNGFPKDITELDFSDYRAGANMALNKKKLFAKLIEEKVPNCLFLNQGQMQFKEEAKAWRLNKPSYSNGAIFADFDQNGQLDIVVNNINENAFLLKNQSATPQNYLQVQFSEETRYNKAIGSKIWLYANNQQQYQEYYLHKSYLSSMSPFLHFGLGRSENVDSLVVQWTSGKRAVFTDIKANQIFNIDESKAIVQPFQKQKDSTDFTLSETPLKHKVSSQIDFSYQPTLPFSYSKLGALVAVADLNRDNLEEIIQINETENTIQIYQPQTGKTRTLESLIDKGVNGLLAVDLNQDGWTDIVVTYGGYNMDETELKQSFQILINNKRNGFQKLDNLKFETKKPLGVIRGHDVDNDGDIDLFLGGSISRNQFPISSDSYVWINNLNDQPNSKLSSEQFKSLGDLGIVMDAIWTDSDNNGSVELMIAAHLKPIQLLSIDSIIQVTSMKIQSKTGFWNSILPLDYDNDGKMDYIISNLGTNTPLSNGESSIAITYDDIDENGSIDVFTGFHYNKESLRVTFEFRNEVTKQTPKMAKYFKDYQTFANTSFISFLRLTGDDFPKEVLVNTVKHQILRNRWRELESYDLHWSTQLSPVFGMTAISSTGNELQDILGATNLSDSREFWGTYSGFNGWFLENEGDFIWFFKTKRHKPRIEGDSRSVIPFYDGQKMRYFVTRVGDTMVELNQKDCETCVYKKAKRKEQSAMIIFKDESKQKVEFYYGSGFRAQAGRGVWIDKTQVKTVMFISSEHTRVVDFE